jgi:nicotinamide-nucleotide amidase
MGTEDEITLAADVLARCRGRRLTLAVAESCTGGLIGGALTAVAGSSDVFDRGFVTYSNVAKTDLLGVPAALLRAKGAVSEEVARAMAAGAIDRAGAGAAVAVTGIAGPGGGGPGRPVGLVHMAAAVRGQPAEAPTVTHARHVFEGDRTAVRRATVLTALRLLRDALA